MYDLIFQVYVLANQEDAIFGHVHKSMIFGFMLIVLLMVTLAISIVTFVILTIGFGRREESLYDELTKQKEASQQEEFRSMNKSTAFFQAIHDIRVSLASINGLIALGRHTQASKLMSYLNLMESCTNDLLGKCFILVLWIQLIYSDSLNIVGKYEMSRK